MRIYNTLTRKKEEFIPLNDQNIKIYVCGPTVYNYFHIGNARPFVVFDTLRRYLEYRGKSVRFVQNFTDVDDKIIHKAREEGVSAGEISEKYIAEYFKDAEALNVRKATVHPKVTEEIRNIVTFVQTLIEKGYAYENDGDVYYSARKFQGYGKLSGQNIEDLDSGARIEIDERKQDPLDFVLWKKRKEDDEIAWDSPWGMGRPGWHIECSAMSKEYLGETIDIHAGGQDLTFPHHENEIAQSEAANGKPFSKYWMHNGYIMINNEKMSKSKDNFFTVRDILKEYSGEEIRFFLLFGHYRMPINFSRKLMKQARGGLDRMYNARTTLEHLIAKGVDASLSEAEEASLVALSKYREKFIAAMDEDLNTADAIAAIFELISDINVQMDEQTTKTFAKQALALILELTHVLGLLEKEETSKMDDDAEIKVLIEERQKAREEKNWARADEIRDVLKAQGITLKDTPQGVQIIRE
ncbi:MAG: cysteine--tRNA ligase [Clostridiales Family XIII bacterium]|jgi:cysteinyl-tRNA synthetase|nr:cysteine--tRNA ligase [Clostridiales Family XIII bacterium]